MPNSEIKKIKLDYLYDPKAPHIIQSNPDNKQINDISYYIPEDKVNFGSEITEKVYMPDPGSNALMGVLAFGEGAGTYFGNNLVALSGLIGKEDETMGLIDNIGKNWGTLFEENGKFYGLNNAAEIKYNDEGWKFGSSLGHVTFIGLGRLATGIPYIGPYLSNALTLGDGYGSAYRMARENGADKETARYIGTAYGSVETLSFGFSGVLPNIGIGTSMPFIETLIETIAENDTDKPFYERYNQKFEESGGLSRVGISGALYGINGAANMKLKTHEKVSKQILNNTGQGISDNQRLKQDAEKVFGSPFVTTSMNSFLSNIFKDIEIRVTDDVPSVRPI